MGPNWDKLPTYLSANPTFFYLLSLRAKCCIRGGVGVECPRNIMIPTFYTQKGLIRLTLESRLQVAARYFWHVSIMHFKTVFHCSSSAFAHLYHEFLAFGLFQNCKL